MLSNTQFLCTRPLIMVDFQKGGISLDWEAISQARGKLDREEGTIFKDWGGRIPVALAFPNSYWVGMSNLGLHVIYRLFNLCRHIVCERVFYPESDHHPISLESQRMMGEFAVIAFSLSFEMDYFNVVAMLRRAGIPLSSQERDESYPLLLGGGPSVTANPEPLAPIFDAFVIGEGEIAVPSLIEVLREGLDGDRRALLGRLATIPGVYVPRFYDVETNDRGILDITPAPGVPYPVRRQWLPDLDSHPATSAIMTDDTEFGGMYLMEVARGCPRGCRFCLAGFACLPFRERSLETLLEQSRYGLTYRHRLGLIAASLSDYSAIVELVTRLRGMGAEISVASLRVDPLPESLLQALSESRVRTLTVAPEAGSERLRRKIGKGISTADILRAAELAARYDFPHLKLYFMLGLPTETEDDVKEIVDLVQAVRERFSRWLTLNITPFVPKAQTPFQRLSMAPPDVLDERLHYVKRNVGSMNVGVRAESSRWAQVQGVLAQGDRRVAEVLMATERTKLSAWRTALEKSGLTTESFVRGRSKDEILPWVIVADERSPAKSRRELAKEAV